MMPHRRLATTLLLILTMVLSVKRASAATPAEVDAAIKKAKTFLRSQQRKDGSWQPEEAGTQFGGYTSIATYALLAGGDSPQDEHIKRAVKWLANAKITGVYALGLRAQVWPYLEPSKDRRAAIENDAKLLLTSSDNFGRWGYTVGGGGQHNSPTQYGVLGLWACARAGLEIPNSFWEKSEKGWWACQCKDGGWQYQSTSEATSRATMTAAGLASLFVAQDYLRSNDGIKCTGNITNGPIEAGLKWMSEHFEANATDGYLLYGIERTGVASGYKYFGKHDWYVEGSNALVKGQAADGSWNSYGPIPGTAFGIFFLARGRAPVVMNKLNYEFEADPKKKPSSHANPKDAVANWNQRPRDAANVVRWMGEHMERDLNWQIVNLKVAPTDLLDAPILYIAGDQQLRFSQDDKNKLRTYVEQGGLILGQADCAKPAFTKSFKDLGKELFPGYEFRVLPPSHLIFEEQFSAAKWKSKIEVEGLSNGSRELMLLIPRSDVARSWQTQATANKKNDFELLSNIFLYAVDKSNLRYKGDTYVITPRPDAKARRTVKVARLRYGGIWNPEPGGWRRMSAHLLNDFGLGLDVKTVRLPGVGSTETSGASKNSFASPSEKAHGLGALGGAGPSSSSSSSRANAKSKAPAEPEVTSLKGFEVAHITGTTSFQLNDAARSEIQQFVEAGGTLLVDAAGGSTAFAEAADRELGQIFKSEASQLDKPMPASAPLYNLPASKVTNLSFRNFARDKLGSGTKTPRLRGLNVKDRLAVIYSKEDLSTGMVGEHVDGIFGYDPKSATQLVTNVILFATNEGNAAGPATQPAAAPPTPKPEPAPKPAEKAKPKPNDAKQKKPASGQKKSS